MLCRVLCPHSTDLCLLGSYVLNLSHWRLLALCPFQESSNCGADANVASTFQNPVPVGSVLYLTATVVFTDPPISYGASDDGIFSSDENRSETSQTRVQVRVDSKVRDVEHGVTKPTGQFNYTFSVDRDIKVMPRTYSEFMMYVDARRRAKGVVESMRQGVADNGKSERITE